ncbi:flagellar export protein FliJ [Thiopseudomonas denitrificans]|uniref:Flagellar FliJ protein n=1 Tax=Thiopseudomonas denitrificans TaxID=1501432 RepID=A0A4R6U6B2_9GAMM|nr:flagellar export protein FliJ [Thiopseudomonas denitrificans]TDQ40065.1 flagellar FliJ protein [Thiopseudomonas denitrificans]
MLKKAGRLAPVVEMAGQAERDAAAKLAKLQVQLQQAEQQLAGLEQYRNDYQQQWITRGQTGVSGEWLMNYQRFLSQLETAIEQQRSSVQWHARNVEKAREQWRQAYARLEGLKKLVQRYHDQARQMADRQEQKAMDEMAARAGHLNRPKPGDIS